MTSSAIACRLGAAILTMALLSTGVAAQDIKPTAPAAAPKLRPAAPATNTRAPAEAQPQARAPAQAAAKSNLPVPPREIQILMVRTALIALDQANKTNNYSVLHALGAPALQTQSAEQMSQAFAGLRAQNLDLAPTVVVNPDFNPAPAVSPQGILQLAGVFKTHPIGVRFNVAMQPVGGFWRLAGLSVGTAGPTVATAPKPAAPKQATAKPATKPAALGAPPALAASAPPPPNADGTPGATTVWRSN